MSYLSALTRVQQLESKLGLAAVQLQQQERPAGFQQALQTAQNRFEGGPQLLNMPAGRAGQAPAAAQNLASTPARRSSGGTGMVPADLKATFEAAAARHKVPVELAKAVARAESGFRHDAVSPAGAQGIMQLMPATGRGLGVRDPFDPAQNIEGGVKYLGGLLRRFNGDVELALAGYNAGPNAVAKYGGIPPYEETQKYVKTVTGYMRDYGYSGGPLAA